MDKQIPMSLGTIVMFALAVAFALGIMKFMIPTTVAQIAGNQLLLGQVNEALGVLDSRFVAIEARLETLERTSASSPQD